VSGTVIVVLGVDEKLETCLIGVEPDTTIVSIWTAVCAQTPKENRQNITTKNSRTHSLLGDELQKNFATLAAIS